MRKKKSDFLLDVIETICCIQVIGHLECPNLRADDVIRPLSRFALQLLVLWPMRPTVMSVLAQLSFGFITLKVPNACRGGKKKQQKNPHQQTAQKGYGSMLTTRQFAKTLRGDDLIGWSLNTEGQGYLDVHHNLQCLVIWCMLRATFFWFRLL